MDIIMFYAPKINVLFFLNLQTVAQWQIVFYITASLYLFGAIYYVIFGALS